MLVRLRRTAAAPTRWAFGRRHVHGDGRRRARHSPVKTPKPTHVIHVFPLPRLLAGSPREDDDRSIPDEALELRTPPGFKLERWQAEGNRLVVCWERLQEPEQG